MRRRYASPDEYDEYPEEYREEGSRRWPRVVLALFVMPLIVGAAIAFFAGRTLGFDAIRRLIDHKFPDGKWVSAQELVGWRANPSRPQPVVLDARTEDEFAVSHLQGAVRIDPYRPSLRPLRGFAKDTAIVVYSSVGYRGARVANFLARQGYARVYNLEGGQFRWANEEWPVFRQGRLTSEVHPYNPTWGLLLESKYRIEAPPLEKRSAAP